MVEFTAFPEGGCGAGGKGSWATSRREPKFNVSYW